MVMDNANFCRKIVLTETFAPNSPLLGGRVCAQLGLRVGFRFQIRFQLGFKLRSHAA